MFLASNDVVLMSIKPAYPAPPSSSPPLEGDRLQMSYNHHHHQTYRSPFLCEQQFIFIARLHQHYTYIIPAHLQF